MGGKVAIDEVLFGMRNMHTTQEAIDHSRFSPWGMEDYLKIIDNGHKKAMMNKDIVTERRGKYISYLSPVELPELNK